MSLNIANINIHRSGAVNISFDSKAGPILVGGNTLSETINSFFRQAEIAGRHICPANTTFWIEFEGEKSFECKECKSRRW